jgi:hypothetical protein
MVSSPAAAVFLDSAHATASGNPTSPRGLGVPQSCVYGECPGSDPDWAIGTLASTGQTSVGTAWMDLASSYTMGTDTYFAYFLVNAPFSAGGTLTCSSTQYTITGIVFQGAVQYSSSNDEPVPFVTLIEALSGSSSVGALTYTWSTDLVSSGTASVTDEVEYVTHNSITGWWFIVSESGTLTYLMVVTSSGVTTYGSPSTQMLLDPADTSCSSNSISSIGTTTSAVSYDQGSYSVDPSMAMEVTDVSAGDFLSDNSNLGVSAYAFSSGDTYAMSYDTTNFNIGGGLVPTNAYGSGLTYETDNNHVTSYSYYDQFGSDSGIQNYIDNEWGLSGASTTQTSGATLPSLNFVCEGNDCPLVVKG